MNDLKFAWVCIRKKLEDLVLVSKKVSRKGFFETSNPGRNRLSFSTTMTPRGFSFKIDLVNAPGPGPTSRTTEC